MRKGVNYKLTEEENKNQCETCRHRDFCEAVEEMFGADEDLMGYEDEGVDEPCEMWESIEGYHPVWEIIRKIVRMILSVFGAGMLVLPLLLRTGMERWMVTVMLVVFQVGFGLMFWEGDIFD